MTTEEIMQKIVEANILDQHDIATIERGLKFQEIYNIMLNEALFKDTNTNIFNFKYQVGQAFGKVKGHCPDCVHCMKISSVNTKNNNKTVKYACNRTNKDVYEYNTCEYFERVED